MLTSEMVQINRIQLGRNVVHIGIQLDQGSVKAQMCG